MARELFGIEQGVHLLSENSDTGVMLLFGSAEPGSIGTFDDDAEVGSAFFRTNGSFYIKDTAGTGTDKWVRQANADDLLNVTWRSELVRAATNEALVAGSTDPTGWADNEQGLADTDFAIGEYVIGDVDGTPALFEVTAISSPNITLAAAGDALADGDTFVVRNYLPDSPAAQEGQAIVTYNGSAIIKLGDVNWDLATGINISSGYTPGAGDVGVSDTVESAIEKLDGNQDNVISILGIDAQTLSDFGTFTGTILTDNSDAKSLFQELETYVEALVTLTSVSQAAVTTAVTLDSVLVDDVACAKWLVTVELDSDATRKRHLVIFAGHDGHAAADAVNVDDTVASKLNLGANFTYRVSVDLNGTGASQEMRLRVSAGAAASFYATRIPNQF